MISTEPKIAETSAAAFTIPTDAPEADGTFAWNSTTLIVVEMKPFIQYSESYDSVSAIHFMPGNRKIIFSDGRNLNLGYGLGDSRRIAAILQKHVDVVPEQRWHLL